MTLDQFFADNPDFRSIAEFVAVPPTKGELRLQYPDISRDILERCDEPVAHSGLVITRGALYLKCRQTANDRFAAMLALGQPPGIETTDTFWAGRKNWREVYAPGYVADVEKRLAAQGIDIGDKEYMPELARFRGDKEAVVPFGGGRGYIKSLCQKRGWACNGAVTTEHREPESDPLAAENCVPLAEHIVQGTMRDMVKKNPDLKRQAATRQGRRRLREEIVAKHGNPSR